MQPPKATDHEPEPDAPDRALRPPSVDRVLASAPLQPLVESHGRPQALEVTRAVLADLRERSGRGATSADDYSLESIAWQVGERLAARERPALRRVFNLTGTVLHTNLGRAPLPEAAVVALTLAARHPTNLEFDLEHGARGDRDDLVEGLLREITGAEAATVVNNNAAAVLLALNTLALRKEAIVSRGELVEIGGSFRIPDVMARAGTKLREVGTTNRTHLADYEQAIGLRTRMLLKVHTSNYEVRGFTASVGQKALADLAHAHGLPLMIDLGSGALVPLERWGLPHEPTVQEALADGADLVSISGDKLLGGPQAGILLGRRALIDGIRRNPLKRALRLDKLTLGALEAVLRLYRDPDRLAERLPTMRLLARPHGELEALAARLLPRVREHLPPEYDAVVTACESQVGSGARPSDRLPSVGLAIRPTIRGRGEGRALAALAAAFRALPVPVVARVAEGTLMLDLRCLDDEKAFVQQLPQLHLPSPGIRREPT